MSLFKGLANAVQSIGTAAVRTGKAAGKASPEVAKAAKSAAKTSAAAAGIAANASKVTGKVGKTLKTVGSKALSFAAANKKLVAAGLVTAAGAAYVLNEANKVDGMICDIVSIKNVDGGVEVKYTQAVDLYPPSDTLNFSGTNCIPALGENVEIVKQEGDASVIVKVTTPLTQDGTTGKMTVNTSVEARLALAGEDVLNAAGDITGLDKVFEAIQKYWIYVAIAIVVLIIFCCILKFM